MNQITELTLFWLLPTALAISFIKKDKAMSRFVVLIAFINVLFYVSKEVNIYDTIFLKSNTLKDLNSFLEKPEKEINITRKLVSSENPLVFANIYEKRIGGSKSYFITYKDDAITNAFPIYSELTYSELLSLLRSINWSSDTSRDYVDSRELFEEKIDEIEFERTKAFFRNMNSNSDQPKKCSEAAIKKQVRATYENLTYVNNIKFTENLYQEGKWLYYYQATSETGNVYSGFATCDGTNIKVTTNIFN
jgi:hypothetical protein